MFSFIVHIWLMVVELTVNHLTNHCSDFASRCAVGVTGESAGPGDVAVAGRVVEVSAFAENPFGPVVCFAKGEIIASDVLLASGETFFSDRKLVHEREAEIAFLGGEIH